MVGSYESGPPVFLDITYSISEFNGGLHNVIFTLLAGTIFIGWKYQKKKIL